jgi:GTP-binding protein HflX
LRDADLLLHVVDASARDPEGQIKTVETILTELGLDRIPRVLVFNKCDRLAAHEVEPLCRRYTAYGISALRPETLAPMIQGLERKLEERVPVDVAAGALTG